MDELDYEELMAQNPTELHQCEGTQYYEDPIEGDMGFVIAVNHEHEVARRTNFYECDDFYEGSAYAYVWNGTALAPRLEMPYG